MDPNENMPESEVPVDYWPRLVSILREAPRLSEEGQDFDIPPLEFSVAAQPEEYLNGL